MNPTLDGFMRNFCQKKPIKMPESHDSNRTAMTQPNVYWTLLTPLVNIVGLYSNVPEGGVVKQPQIDWFQNELATLDRTSRSSSHCTTRFIRPTRFTRAART